jgi:uncharacterized protein involved in exopolysaccharide biosynthesis
MDTFGQSDSDMQARSAQSSSSPSEFSPDRAAASGTRRGFVRRLARHGWKILALWLVGSTVAAYLIYELIEPTFQAVSILRIEPSEVQLFATRDWRGERSSQSYLQTQLEIIKRDSVLEDAITSPTVIILPRSKNSADPKTELRNDLIVEPVGKGTWLIRVALESHIPSDAAAIVNAVVDAYMKQHNQYDRSANSDLKKSLEAELGKLKEEIEETKTTMRKLAEAFRLGALPRLAGRADENHADPVVQPALRAVTAEQWARLTDRLIQADLELIDARARLEAARLAREQQSRAKPRGPQPQPDQQATPRSTPEGPGLVSEEKLRELEAAVEEAKRRKIGYTQYIEKLKVESQTQSNDTLSYKLAEQDLGRLQSLQASLKERLKQLDFEIGQDKFRVTLVDRAREPRTPSNTTLRLALMAVAPIGVFFLIVGGFLLVEITAGRAAGPTPSGPTA